MLTICCLFVEIIIGITLLNVGCANSKNDSQVFLFLSAKYRVIKKHNKATMDE